MKRILVGLVTIAGAAAAMYIGTTGAFFSDTESSTGNTFAAGAIDLLVDNESYYNGNRCTEVAPDVWQWQGPNPYPVPDTPCTTSWNLDNLSEGHLFFNFLDLKPDDEGEDTISLHVQNDAWACMNITLTSNDENDLLEPEVDDGDDTTGVNGGELAQNIQMLWWADDGDNVFEDDENILASDLLPALDVGVPRHITLADSLTNAWGDGAGVPLPANETVYIAKAWCFGTLTQNPVAAGQGQNPQVDSGILCDGLNLNNVTQTDSATLDISFSAVQARNNPDFVCEAPPPPPELQACTDPTVQEWADSVVVADQGRRQDGSAILAARTDPTKTLGPAETAGLDSDVVPPGSTFYSLGFGVATSATRSVTVAFDDNIIINDTGPDVRIYEVTGGTYPDELARVEASQDGISWTTLVPDANRDEDLDLGVLPWARYIRVTDLSVAGDAQWVARPDADGYDVDAVRALNCGEPIDDGPPNGGGNGGGAEILLLSESFGTDAASDIPNWEEDDGAGADTAIVAAGGSPDGGAFARIDGGGGANTGWICRNINATGVTSIMLSYYWRALVLANNPSDDGLVEFKVGGTCSDNAESGTGWTNLKVHDLNLVGADSWNTQAAFVLPVGANNTNFLIRFRSSTNSATEDFHIDGVVLTGTTI